LSASTDPALDDWIEIEHARAIDGMLLSVSPVGLVKTRPGFGQVIRPLRGAIVASPVLASYDPDPDYFFHWYRDSALIVDALKLLRAGAQPRTLALGHLQDFIEFSLALQALDGRRLAGGPWRSAVSSEFVRYLRTPEDLDHAHGPAIAGETRVNADGTLDISQWARPQHDGPALRALALLRWGHGQTLPESLNEQMARLLKMDLAYARVHGRLPCFDIWEEERALHYYTLRVSAAALEQGSGWLQQRGEHDEAAACAAEASALYELLDGFWLADRGHYASRLLPDGGLSAKALDIAVLLAAVHAGPTAGRHDAGDPRMHSTLERLTALFERLYPINRALSADEAPALGRFEGDVYYSGGAWYISTLAAAEFCYQAAALRAGALGRAEADGWFRRGDRFLRTVRRYTPANGELSEQFDQRTGRQTSAKHLSWSYAAFLTCTEARRAAVRAVSRGL
jgi:glucoamylase